jgi:hypothetical protein|eukprot:30820-Pelagococcus_subviridis.AAC.1
MKRRRTRQAIGRPAVGPTSWAAVCSNALWRVGELEAAIARDDGDDGDGDGDEGGGSRMGGFGFGFGRGGGGGADGDETSSEADSDDGGFEGEDEGDLGMVLDLQFDDELGWENDVALL